jgi:Fic family protein
VSYDQAERKPGLTMSDSVTNIHVLDAGYKPFPAFEDWAARTSVETVRWDRYIASLKEKAALSPEVLNRAREIAKRFAALDTGAIEGLYQVDRGFTYTVAFETAAWEVELAKKGEHVRPLFEAQLHAYDYVLDLATKAEPISEAAIRVLHEEVCRAQATYRVMTAVGPQEQALTKGRYKVLPNHVRSRDGADHPYAPVDVTPAEMARLVGELRGEEFMAAHPVIQASYAHYCLVVIHPFADGNGRVARALASAFTYRAISMPIVILSEHKEVYLDALEAADSGRYQVFVDFMLDRALDTIVLVNESLLGASAPSLEESAAAITRLYITRGGYEQAQVDEAGRSLGGLILAEIGKSISKIAGPNLNGQANFFIANNVRNTPSPTHRLLLRDDDDLIAYVLELHTAAPAPARLDRKYALWLPKDANSDDDILFARIADNLAMVALDLNEIAFSARIGDLIPAISGVLQIRTSLFADRIVGEMLRELLSAAGNALNGKAVER